jgi:hypothetical protein
MARNITAANATILLTAPDVFGAPVQIQGFSADNIYDTDSVEPVETAMGVDGILSGGFTPRPVDQVFMVQADSTSIDFFEGVFAWQQQNLGVETLSGTTLLLSTQKFYMMPKGFMVAYTPLPAAHRILQPRRFTIRWEKVFPSPAPNLIIPGAIGAGVAAAIGGVL